MSIDHLISDLANDVRPVRPLKSAPHRYAVALAISLVILLAGIGYWFNAKGEFNLPLGRSLLEAALVLCLFLLSSWHAILSVSPHTARARMAKSEALMLFLWIGVIGGAFVSLHSRDPEGALEALGYHTWTCPAVILSMAVPAAMALHLLLRRGFALYPCNTYLYWSLSVFALGVFGLAFICPWADPLHELLWHALPAAIGVGTLFLARFLWTRTGRVH